ncbi:MAG TPA: SDR family oxidoreductase [Polyangiales bacterium]
MSSYDFRNKTVLITGASMGIGEAFARALAERGARLVLVARSERRLTELAAELGGATVIVQDLAQRGAARRVFEVVEAHGLAIDVLINNAGFATRGTFGELSLELQREEIDLNVGALVELTHVFLPMLERRRGGVIHVASTAGFQPVPYMAVYGATKAFVLSFSEALWAEYHERGVRVLALCPGSTDTPFFDRVGDGASVGTRRQPEDVVASALRAFDRNQSYVVDGLKNYWLAQASRFVPRRTTIRITANMMRPRPALPSQASPG